MLDAPFVPDGDAALLDEIDARWERRRAENPALHDGRLTHVIGVHRNGYGGAVLHVADCAYRYHAVQDEQFDLGVRPLGVKGFTMREGQVLLGRRASWVNAYGGQWEFAPGGVVEPGRKPNEVVTAELQEETGLRPQARPTPLALIFDGVLRCWEMVFRVDAAPGKLDLSAAEYDDARWCTPDDLPAELTPVAKQMVELLGAQMKTPGGAEG